MKPIVKITSEAIKIFFIDYQCFFKATPVRSAKANVIRGQSGSVAYQIVTRLKIIVRIIETVRMLPFFFCVFLTIHSW